MNSYVNLAKKSIEEYVKNGKRLEILRDLPAKLLNNKAGTFVSIHKKPKKNQKEGELRGCIGTFLPTKDNIAQEIVDNAISACSRDFRFSPITKNELDDLEISVDVLSKPEKIEDIKKLNPKKYGVLIKSKNDSRSSLLLPDLEDVTTIHDQMAIVLGKASISPQEPIDIFRFTVIRHKE